jgi:hypothetical protein
MGGAGRHDVFLEFATQEEAPRQVVAQTAAHVGRLLRAVIRHHQGGLRLDAHHAGSEHHERRQPRLRIEDVHQSQIGRGAIRGLAEEFPDRQLRGQVRIREHRPID